MSKIKEIFKGNASDADKSEAFTGGEGSEGGAAPINSNNPGTETAGAGGVSSQAQGGAGSSGSNLPSGDVGNQGSKAAGLGSQAQSGENTSSFTG